MVECIKALFEDDVDDDTVLKIVRREMEGNTFAKPGRTSGTGTDGMRWG